MSDINDGGPAFPRVTTEWNPGAELREVTSEGGMTLRDYFAAKAMQGMLADHECNPDPEPCARVAYSYADAMLRAREANHA